MHLVELVAARGDAAAGLIIELTRRCPLSCAHCSTSSTSRGTDLSRENLCRFIGTFTDKRHPKFVSLTGGEPLLRSSLVEQISGMCHSVDTKVHVLTGAYFARQEHVPAALRRALRSVDHVAFSLDAFHEREVDRCSIFRVMDGLRDEGIDVSLQIVGLDESDPYLGDAVDHTRRWFNDDVPMLVSVVRSIGRAQQLALPTRHGAADAPSNQLASLVEPCSMVAWPVLCSDGRVTACCNQDIVDGRHVEHLALGDASSATWETVSKRMTSDATIGCLRSLGPRVLSRLRGLDADADYCTTCHDLASGDVSTHGVTVRTDLLDAIAAVAAERPRDREAAQAFTGRYGLSPFADLIALGAS